MRKRPWHISLSLCHNVLLDGHGTGGYHLLLVAALHPAGLVASLRRRYLAGRTARRPPPQRILNRIWEAQFIGIRVAIDEFARVAEVPILQAELGSSTCRVPCTIEIAARSAGTQCDSGPKTKPFRGIF